MIKKKWKEGRKEGREGREGDTFVFKNAYIVCKSGFQIHEMSLAKVRMEHHKGEDERTRREPTVCLLGPDSILRLDLDSGYSGVYFLIILLTEYVYWMGFSISMSPFKILRISFLIEKMKAQQILCLGFCPFLISHPTWIEVLLRGLWYTVRTPSMGTLHSLQSRMETSTSLSPIHQVCRTVFLVLPTSSRVPAGLDLRCLPISVV